MDPLIVVGGGATILGSKDLLNKFLGPAAEYFGKKTLNLVQKCDINLDNIFRKAFRKLGKRIEERGQVNPRILKSIIYDGSFIEDDLAQEYYAGVLVASRSNDELDDRGVTFLIGDVHAERALPMQSLHERPLVRFVFPQSLCLIIFTEGLVCLGRP